MATTVFEYPRIAEYAYRPIIDAPVGWDCKAPFPHGGGSSELDSP